MNIDYKLYIKGERKSYEPRSEIISPLTNSEHKVFEITAGNSYGKTFLLNLIAFASFSDELHDEHILGSIKDSISRYQDTKYCDLEYQLEFSLPEGGLMKLQKKSDSPRQIFFKGEELDSPNEFHKLVTVLYDVPTDPYERLNAVIRDLGIWNNNLHKKMENYWKYLRELQSNFDNVRDDSKITSLEGEISLLKTTLADRGEVLVTLGKRIKDIEVIINLEELISLHKSLKYLNGNLDVASSKLKSLKRPKRTETRDEDLIKSLQRDKNQKKVDLKNLLHMWISLINNKKELQEMLASKTYLKSDLDEIVGINLDELLNSDDYVAEANKFKKNIQSIREELYLFIREQESGKKYIVHRFLFDLLDQVKQLVELNADDILKELTNTSSSQFIDEIEKKMQQHESPDFSEVISFMDSKLDSIQSLLADSFRLNGEIERQSRKTNVNADGNLYYSTEAEVDKLKSMIGNEESKIEGLKYQLSKYLNIKHSKLDTLKQTSNILAAKKLDFRNSVNFKTLLNDKQIELKSLEEDKNRLEQSLNRNLVRLDAELQKKQSQFTEMDKEKIKRVTRLLQFLVLNLGGFKRVISSIKTGNFEEFQDEKELQFIDVAGKIIAYSMDNKILRVDGRYIRLESYDLVQKTFHCEDGIVIRKEDISTGLASANYLRQRIENLEGDYVIILLDEIGNMAKDTLGEVIKSIKKLESQNRLIAALLTQPSSQGIKVIEY